MKKYFYMAVAAIAVLSSCSNDNEFEPNQPGKQSLVFTATMENSEGTRATYDSDNKCAAWEEGDQISINGKTYSAQAAGTTTTFKADGDDATGETYTAYFPASLYNGTKATLPAIQTYTAGKFNMPMYATSTTTSLQFYNLCAVLAIKVTSADIATLKSIKVASDKVMNGSFTVTDNKAVMGTDGTNVVVLESSNPLTLNEAGTTFHIAIPAQDYMYLNIFLSADGETYTQAMATKKAAGLGEIARSKIFNIDYAKNATKLWEGNLFIADCNVGAKTATEYGGYYTWGGTYRNGKGIAWNDDHETGYTYSSNLKSTDDTATKLWGSNWRMPTTADFNGFIDNCDGKLIDGSIRKNNNTTVAGHLFTGKEGTAYSSNSVFLPAAGICYVGSVYEQGKVGRYWSSTYGSSLIFMGDLPFDDLPVVSDYLSWGSSVRAVLAE